MRASESTLPCRNALTPAPASARTALLARALTIVALVLFALSAWLANRDICPACAVSDITLQAADGTPIHARFYRPPPSAHPAARTGPRSPTDPSDASSSPESSPQSANLPAVVICPGYLANMAFMELPWAADLTRIGVAALFLDRRGQGRSGGMLWPRPAGAAASLDEMELDIAAATTYLRKQGPLIDPTRIALLGHSDGGTAVITAAAADWDLEATVAVSASIAPSQLVNHVAPQNLLLVYGAEDHFVLHDTDSALIAHATRGYLVSPGRFGDVADGSGRALLRVPHRGHLDVLHSDSARREILDWLRRSLRAEGSVALSSHRWPWVWTGLIGLVLLLFCAGGGTGAFHAAGVAHAQRRCDHPGTRGVQRAEQGPWRSVRVLALAGSWSAGLLLAPTLARYGQQLVPAHEGSVFAGLLLGPTIALTLAGVVLVICSSGVPTHPIHRKRVRLRDSVAEGARGLVLSAALFGAVHLLLLHHYGVWVNPSRLVLTSVLLVIALPIFCILESWLRAMGTARAWSAPGCLLLLAAQTAVLSARLFERMSMVPGFLLAAVLVCCAAYRAGHYGIHPATAALLGAGTISWLGGVVCPLY